MKININPSTPLLDPLIAPEQKPESKVGKVAQRVLLGSGMILATAVSIPLHSLLRKVATDCYDAEMKTQKDFNICNAPFVPHLLLYHSLLTFSGILMGYSLQGIWEKREGEVSQNCSSRIKSTIHFLQSQYSYEALFLLIYIYNGIGIDVSNSTAFRAFLMCTAGSLATGGAFLGMYMRMQQVFLRTFSPSEKKVEENTVKYLMNNRLSLSAACIALGLIGLRPLTNQVLPSKIQTTISGLCAIFAGRQVGLLCHHITRPNENQDKSIEKVKAIFHRFFWMHNFFTLLGYTLFFTTPPEELGLSLVGVAQGFHKANLAALTEKENLPSLEQKKKWYSYFCEYWKTAAVVGFSIALQITRFMDCKGPPTPLNFSCPIGLETSVYVAGNQVVIDSTGVNAGLISSLAHYYLRKGARYFSEKKNCSFLRTYVDLTDQLYYTMLSMIPFFLIQSGNYAPEDDDFYTFNPLLPILLIGITFSSHRERNDYLRRQSHVRSFC